MIPFRLVRFVLTRIKAVRPHIGRTRGRSSAPRRSIRIFVATESEGLPSSWDGLLQADEIFVEGSGHAEETILNFLGDGWMQLAGGASRNVCSEVCAPLIEGSGGGLDGPEFRWNSASGSLKTAYRIFWW